MKKLFFHISAVLAGAAAAVIICGCFSVVEIESGAMLPDIEPGARVLVYKGGGGQDAARRDMVVVELPYYSMDEEGHYAVRTVKARYGDVIELTCEDASSEEPAVPDEDRLVVKEEDILGKVIASF